MDIEELDARISKLEDAHEQQLADATANYNKLLVEILNVCSNNPPHIAIAACASAMGCIAVDAIPDINAAHRYIQGCTTDVRNRLEEAYNHKTGSSANGSDAREESQDSDQGMVN